MGRATITGAASSNKREAILGAALRCFAAQGLAGTGMRDIARSAGLTEGTLYHYFESKGALIDEAFRASSFQASDVREAMLRSGPSLRARLLSVADEFLAALSRNPEWTRVVIRESLRTEANADADRLRHGLVALARERSRILARTLADEMAAGRIRRCDPHRMADQLFHGLIGHWLARAIGGGASAARRAPEPFLVQLVEMIVADLTARGRRASPSRRRARGGP